MHIERANSGSLVVSQRGTASGEYETAFVKGMYEGGIVIDCDFGALVYPKWIKVTSSSEVVSASVNFNEGGGSGSGSGSEQSSTIEYIDVRGWNSAEVNNSNLSNLTQRSIMIKVKDGNEVGCTYTSNIISWRNTMSEVLDILDNDVIAVAIDFNLLAKWSDYEATLKEDFIEMGIYEYISSLPRITKEEFYNLDNNSVPA